MATHIGERTQIAAPARRTGEPEVRPYPGYKALWMWLLLGAAFGLMNLIGEMGAVLSPAISGVLRDATGDWTAAVFLDGGLMLVSFVLLCLVRERRAVSA
jgi:nitrate/nitrite transporter NarK